MRCEHRADAGLEYVRSQVQEIKSKRSTYVRTATKARVWVLVHAWQACSVLHSVLQVLDRDGQPLGHGEQLSTGPYMAVVCKG